MRNTLFYVAGPSVIGTAMVLALSALLAGCAPTHTSFLEDASATCGNANLLFPAERTYQTADTPAAVNTTYDCVQGYLRKSPEYQGQMTAKETDAAYVDGMRRIDLARSAGQITPVAAQEEGAALFSHYKASIGQP